MSRLQSRPAHYALLAAVQLLLTLPNLGAHTLWDMDEGVNAEAAREMLESGNWITPYFNYEMRTAKPAFLYWLQSGSFRAFGVNEVAARLPAVLCGLWTVLVTYELGRRLFAPSTGLLAGLVLASCIEFCLISHSATPDPPLVLFLTSAFYCYWAGSEGDRRWWFVPFGALCGLAVLVKGPIGLGLPGLIVLIHLAWTRQLRKLWDRRLIGGALACILVAGWWYGLVALDTKGKWVRAFLVNENFNRFHTPAENHSGRVWDHALVLFALFAPWSTFLIPTVRRSVGEARQPLTVTGAPDTANKYRFLLVWFLTVLVFFSLAATKLPNYVLPLYPALAILVARWLDRWRTGDLAVRPWVLIAAAAGCILVGVGLAVALVLLSGAVNISVKGKALGSMPALAPYAWLGVIPVAAGLWFGWQAVRGRRDAALAGFAAGAVAFLAATAALVPPAMNEYKVSQYFADEVGLRQTDREIRIAAASWFRHSLVFYARREVTRIQDPAQVDVYLSLPLPVFLVVPEEVWTDPRAPQLTSPHKVIARRYDFYAQQYILVVANAHAAPD